MKYILGCAKCCGTICWWWPCIVGSKIVLAWISLFCLISGIKLLLYGVLLFSIIVHTMYMFFYVVVLNVQGICLLIEK